MLKTIVGILNEDSLVCLTGSNEPKTIVFSTIHELLKQLSIRGKFDLFGFEYFLAEKLILTPKNIDSSDLELLRSKLYGKLPFDKFKFVDQGLLETLNPIAESYISIYKYRERFTTTLVSQGSIVSEKETANVEKELEEVVRDFSQIYEKTVPVYSRFYGIRIPSIERITDYDVFVSAHTMALMFKEHEYIYGTFGETIDVRIDKFLGKKKKLLLIVPVAVLIAIAALFLNFEGILVSTCAILISGSFFLDFFKIFRQKKNYARFVKMAKSRRKELLTSRST